MSVLLIAKSGINWIKLVMTCFFGCSLEKGLMFGYVPSVI